MISFIPALIFSLSVFSQTLSFSIERSTPLGLDKVEIIQNSSSTVINKTSNWFDKAGDTRLGKLQVTRPSLLVPIISELHKIQSEMIATDNRLKKMGTSYSDLNSNKAPHSPYFRFNGYRVETGSTFYPELEKIAAKIKNLDLILFDGVELDKDRKQFIFYKEGKQIKREQFDARFFCQSPNLPTRCLAREWGALYLK